MNFLVSRKDSEHGKPYKGGFGVALTVSSFQLEKIPADEGKLYRAIFLSKKGTFIGEYQEGYLVSGASRTPTYGGLVEEVNPENVKVFLLNSDGKQTDKDIVMDNVGNYFDLIEIGTHEKYKYIVKIDDKKVALSAENCFFFVDDMVGSFNISKGTYVSYYGTTLKVIGTVTHICQSMYKLKCIITGNTFYIPLPNLKVCTSLKTIKVSRALYNEIYNKFNIIDSTNTEFNGLIISDPFNNEYLVEEDGYCLLKEITLKSDDYENILKLTEDRYYVKDGVFFLKKNLIKRIDINGNLQSTRRGGGRRRTAPRNTRRRFNGFIDTLNSTNG